MTALSRALFGRPRLLFLDEPNAHLDVHGEAMLTEMPKQARSHGVTVIVSTHRTGLLQAAHRILLMRDGAVEFVKNRDEALRPQSGPPTMNRQAGPGETPDRNEPLARKAGA